jgi:hypothetical protein
MRWRAANGLPAAFPVGPGSHRPFAALSTCWFNRDDQSTSAARFIAGDSGFVTFTQ